LQDSDPTLDWREVENCALAYADGLDLADPRVSTLYADFKKGFPPTLITEGTKSILLSTGVRLYQALAAAGQEAKLDVYEGMWHVFQNAPIPETGIALRKSATFVNQHVK